MTFWRVEGVPYPKRALHAAYWGSKSIICYCFAYHYQTAPSRILAMYYLGFVTGLKISSMNLRMADPSHNQLGFPRDRKSRDYLGWNIQLSLCPGTKKFPCPPLHLSLDQGAGQRATAKIKLLCPRTSQDKITTWLSKKVKNWYFFFFFSFSFFPFFSFCTETVQGSLSKSGPFHPAS